MKQYGKRYARLVALIATHSKESWGMSPNTPDKCTCGAEVYPDPYCYDEQSGYVDISIRRNRAFAEHVAKDTGSNSRSTLYEPAFF